MAKKKITTPRCARVPNGFTRVELIMPTETANRIADHCHRNSINNNDFLRKAVYDALPVHYEVTEDWTFPFGKYAGETADVVKRIDPSYIEWCKKNIIGFHDKQQQEEAAHEADRRANIHSVNVPAEQISPATCYNLMYSNEVAAITRFKFWAKDEQGRCHLIAMREGPHASWHKITARKIK